MAGDAQCQRRVVGPQADLSTAPGRELVAVWLFGTFVVVLAAGVADDRAPTTSGWLAVATLSLAVAVVVLRDQAGLAQADVALIASLGMFTGWVALSLLWTPSVPSTVQELQRSLAYLALVACALLLVRRRTVPALLAGVLAGIAGVAAYALATRLQPERYGDFQATLRAGYRLAAPVGSWNALACLATIGLLLAIGFAARAERLPSRSLAAAAIPALALVLFFTFSRGAWLALVMGLLVLALADTRRLQLAAVGLAVAPWPLAAVLIASRLDGLVSRNTTLEAAAHDGRTLLWLLPLLSAAAAAAIALLARLEQRVTVPGAARALAVALIAAGAMVALVTIWVVAGSPAQLVDRALSSVESSPTEPTELTGRLLDLSANSRLGIWRVAWHRFEQEPLLGGGAGTYWQMHAADREPGPTVEDAHSLYLETLAELGVVGLLLLTGALAVPPVVAARTRTIGLVPPALAAYAAFLVHAALDPDWEVAGLTATALLVAAAIVVGGRPDVAGRTSVRARLLLALPLSLFGLLAGTVLLGEIRVERARSAVADGDADRALTEARHARELAPWSSQAWAVAGDAHARAGRAAAARRSYREALERDPRNWRVWAALAAVSSDEEYRRAISRLEELHPLVREHLVLPPRSTRRRRRMARVSEADPKSMPPWALTSAAPPRRC